MKSYFCHPDEGLPLLKLPSTDDGQPIWIGAPIYGPPRIDDFSESLVAPLRHHLFLDLNLLAHVRQGKNRTNIAQLINIAANEHWQIEIFFAAVELHRTHAKPLLPLEESARALWTDYRVHVYGDLRKFSSNILKTIDDRKNEIQLLADFCIVIKHFYRQKWELRRKIREFSDLISRKLPCLTTGYLLGCLLFYVKENRNLFPDFVSKIQSDMSFSGNLKKDKTNALNLASDLSYFTTSTLAFNSMWPDDFHLIRIASSDALMGLILSEMCYGTIHIVNGIPNGAPAFRKHSIADNNLKEITKEFMPQPQGPYGVRYGINDERRRNLARAAEEFLKQ